MTIPRLEFELGQVVWTQGINKLVAEDVKFAKFVTECLIRHKQSDWGTVGKEDRLANERALMDGSRLVSVYETDGLPGIWVITESDRTATTVLFPSEY